nr:uncharacterized protein LOC105868985 [Microcebus murinus]
MADKWKFWGATPAILKMSRDPTTLYTGRAMWVSVTFLYVSVVYVVQISWLDMAEDFQCHGNISDACLAECYESHFTSPVLGVWYFVGFVFSSIFFVMEFAVSRNVHNLTKAFRVASLEEKESSNTVIDIDCTKKEKEVTFDLSEEKPLLAMYLVYFLVQMSVQVIFLVILFHSHRPLITKPIWCSTYLCHGPYLCVLMGTQEKIMSIILLATVSVVIVIFCLIFFLYTINEYRVTSVTLSRRNKSFAKA